MEWIFAIHLTFSGVTLSDLMSLEAETGSLLQNLKNLMSSGQSNSELRKKFPMLKENLMSYAKKARVLRQTQCRGGRRAGFTG